MKNAFEYEAELSALREELDSWKSRCTRRVEDIKLIAWRLTAAEQRNAELTRAIADAEYRADQGKVWNGMGWTYTGLHSHGQQTVLDILRAALKPTEAGGAQ